ncbi:hypothetical protein ABID29_001781 [Streptococcus rupicaprae]|uniref:Uncharacterized protein n=1 Tax=Streptococcus rupicaprae TaxID=759619 RepID=A0ABV2FJA7_9STRE
MGKLSPKPQPIKKYSWEDLNAYLNMIFTSQHDHPRASINYHNYNMSKNDIIVEAEKSGYKVTDEGNGYLTFE